MNEFETFDKSPLSIAPVRPSLGPVNTESIRNVSRALAEARKAFPTVQKTRTGSTGGREFKYADLQDVLDAIDGPMFEKSLLITHTLIPPERPVSMLTKLIHWETGESLETSYPMAAKSKDQDYGAAITYARRYSISMILGIHADDDDLDKAPTESHYQELAPRNPAPPRQPAFAPVAPIDPVYPERMLTDRDMKNLERIMHQCRWSAGQVKGYCRREFQTEDPMTLTREQFTFLLNIVQSKSYQWAVSSPRGGT